MRIEASMDKTKPVTSPPDEVTSLKLIAETDGERKHLAALYGALMGGDMAVINMPIKDGSDN